MKVHGMREGVILVADQGEVHRVPFGDPHDRARHLSVERPGLVLRPVPVNDDFRFHRGECDFVDFGACRPRHGDTSAGSQKDSKS